jgi:hypothetical protein
MALDPSVATQRVSQERLRQIFNEGQYWERVQAGEFRAVLLREANPDPIKSGQPVGTKSQILVYLDSNDIQVALVHQYFRPDGTLGGNGRPDPKKVLKDGVLYILNLGS